MYRPVCRFLALVIVLVPVAQLRAESMTLAVASNFVPAAEKLVARFEQTYAHDVRLVPGSSGKLFAQIVNGAPFDVFLSADVERPARLESEGFAVAGSGFVYAQGELVLWSRDARFLGSDCMAALGEHNSARIAIANPLLAPYGLAARQALEHAQLWASVQPRLVVGENVAQALQFAAAGGAGFAFVGAAQLKSAELPAASCSSVVADGAYEPIAQQAVLLTHGAANASASAFLAFLQSDAARELIAANGYRLPANGAAGRE